MQVLCLYGPKKSKPRLKSELFWLNHWAHVIVLWQCKKLMCYCTVFAILFWIWGQFPSTNPQGRVFGGAIYRRFFALRVWGGGGGLYLKGLIFRILRYMAVINLPTNAALTMLNYFWRCLLHSCMHPSLTRSDQKDDIMSFQEVKIIYSSA